MTKKYRIKLRDSLVGYFLLRRRLGGAETTECLEAIFVWYRKALGENAWR
jgi:hypothetical protein